MERNESLRAEFLKIADNLHPERVFYIDESGIDKYLYREYGYSLKGTPIEGKISGKKFKRTNIVAAKCCDKIVSPLIYDGTTDSMLFECWFEKMLLKSVPKGLVLIMDNRDRKIAAACSLRRFSLVL